MAVASEYGLGPHTFPRGWFVVAESRLSCALIGMTVMLTLQEKRWILANMFTSLMLCWNTCLVRIILVCALADMRVLRNWLLMKNPLRMCMKLSMKIRMIS